MHTFYRLTFKTCDKLNLFAGSHASLSCPLLLMFIAMFSSMFYKLLSCITFFVVFCVLWKQCKNTAVGLRFLWTKNVNHVVRYTLKSSAQLLGNSYFGYFLYLCSWCFRRLNKDHHCGIKIRFPEWIFGWKPLQRNDEINGQLYVSRVITWSLSPNHSILNEHVAERRSSTRWLGK